MAHVEFVSYIENVKNATDEMLEAAAEAIGQRMESHAKLYVTAGVYQSPEGWYVRTGNLRNRITHDKQQDSDGNVIIMVGTNLEYAPYVELGTGIHAEGGDGRKTPWRYQDSKGNWHTTRGMPPRPFLRPAVERHKEEYRGVLKDMGLKD